MDFHYDSQHRRYLLQFMRIFSDIKVRNGPDTNGIYTLSRVPIVYGDPSWVVAQLLKGASENTLMPAPMFSAYIESIKMAPDRRQDTMFVGKVSTLERGIQGTSPAVCDNNQSPVYTSKAGIRYDVDRYMPVPYDMYLKLDCWTTNTSNKMQIAEQQKGKEIEKKNILLPKKVQHPKELEEHVISQLKKNFACGKEPI